MWHRYTGQVSREMHSKLSDRPSWQHGAWYAINNADQVMVHRDTATLGRAGVGATAIEMHRAGGARAPFDAGLGALPNGVVDVAQNTDVSGDLNVRSAPGTSSSVNGGIPQGALFYIMGAPVDVNGNPWPSGSNDMPTGDPNQNAWYPAASADFSVAGFVAAGPGSSGERLTTITGQTDPIIPGPNPNPPPIPTPPPAPPPPGPTPATPAAKSNVGTIVGVLAGAAVIGGGAYYLYKKRRR